MNQNEKALAACRNCKSTDLQDAYVYIKCKKCGMTGPQMNSGNNDAHPDWTDHEAAIKAWNRVNSTESQPVAGKVGLKHVSGVDSPDRCNPDVREYGELFCIFDCTEEEAEEYRKSASNSEWLYDWYFCADRVVMKRLSLRTAPQPQAPAVEVVSVEEIHSTLRKFWPKESSFQIGGWRSWEMPPEASLPAARAIHALLTSKGGR